MLSYRWLSALGGLEVTMQNEQIVGLSFTQAPPSQEPPASPLLGEVVEQMKAYLAGRLQRFSLPLAPLGTEFQQQVWHALTTIPYGQVWSYRQLAEAVGRPKGYRAVGQANGKNPIAIIIPCHRVIAADGTIGGYSGGLHHKHALLQHEGVQLA